MRVRLLLQRLLAAVLVLSMVLPATSVLAAGNGAPVRQANAEQGVVRPGGADLYDVPNGAVVARLEPISFVTLVGRTEEGDWVVVITPDNQNGWVQTSQLITYNTERLPVLLEEVEPTATPVPPTPTPLPPTPTPVPPTATPAPPTATPTRLAPTQAPTTVPAAVATAAPAAGGAVTLPSLPAPTDIVGVVGVDGATLYAAPDGAAVRDLPVGSAVALLARNAETTWLQGRTQAGETGWLMEEAIIAFNLPKLPVVNGNGDAAAPAPNADQAPTAAATLPPSAESDSGSDADAAGATATATEADFALAPDAEEAIVEQSPASAIESETAGAATPAAPAAGSAALVLSAAAQQPRPAPASDGRPTARVTMSGARLNIRSGPGTTFPLVSKALPDDIFVLTGRTDTSDWLQVELTAAEGGQGWVSAAFVESSLPLSELPVVETGAAPAPLPVATPDAAAPAAPIVAVSNGVSAPAAVAPVGPAGSVDGTGLTGNIVFQDGNNGIFRANLDTGDVTFLTNGYDPAISPDGRVVAFSRGGGGDNGIYTIGIDGSNERKIWGEGELLRSPKWSPDGARIVFSRLTGSYKCYDLKFIGCKSLRQLIAEFPFLIIPEARRRFLRDAERLEFPNWGISRIASSGGEFRDIAALDSAVAPDWNAAGIVYQSTAGIEVTEDTPTGTTRAIFQEDWDHDPDWQPNGGFMLFQSKEGSHWEIWRITPGGTGVTALTRPETTLVEQLPSNVAPAWSYDGQQIVYLSSRRDDEDTGPWRLWVMNADGSGKRPLGVDLPIDYAFASEQVADWGPPVE